MAVQNSPPLSRFLRMAVLAGVESAVQIHIDRGDNLNARDDRGQTPLMLSAARNKAAICKLLLSAGADAGLIDPSGRDMASDEQLLDHIRTNGNCGWHQVGTCRMGKDAMAVVDPRLRVHGIRRLRVADGAVMPAITSGNTNAPCIMIGERAAAMIREDALPRRV